MHPQAYCHKVCRESSSNFVHSFRFMPKKRRVAFEAFYAFCRLVDDAVDEASSADEAKRGLDEWRNEIERVYDGTPTHPVGQALSPVVKDFSIPENYFEEIIAGCEMDLTQKRYATFAELETYCYRVACCVGLVCLHLFGVELNPRTREAAIALGKAVQLTNILRDVTPDLSQGRIYIPQESLQQFGVSEPMLKNGQCEEPHLADLILYIGKQAQSFYVKAWDGFPENRQAKRRLLAATMMGKTYETLLKRIIRNPLDIFKGKVRVPLWKKLTITGQIIGELYSPRWISKKY